METYKSKAQRIACDINTIYSKLSSPTVFKAHIDANRDKLPEEALANMDKVQLEDDAIAIESPMGQLRLVVDHEKCSIPNRIVYTAAQSPVGFNMCINLADLGNGETESVAELDLDLPPFLRAMVNKQLKEAADKFGEMLAQLPYAAL
ncbi:MAG: hypothetical protein J6S96_04600 [Muribaculaceae bacterium]|nr:hypothetical protein [Muribaculaceae bacterium]